ncbi:NADAR family protein [Paenibacillus sp. ACRRX]|uniref:NADAR family protein n=1 Tax=Paenibacillus sp. ACRRX TaxID=2918206 RepID=UPI001EF73058|nr:NADAR family protein [Paenibacillus sp. ACRRX]MCG7408325.1 NADAR family protein [Paenibacillus sp. ACRRX]
MIYNIEQLRKAYIAGNTFKFVFFWGHTPPKDGGVDKSCFSQWWMSPFMVEGYEYSCVEQFMMAEKARLFGDGEMLDAILKAKYPKEMKAYGRAVRDFDNDTWDNECYGIVKRGNLAKFSQDPKLGDYLKSTKNRILVEASPRDRIWGIGMGKSNPDVENPIKWRGRNLLGFVLTEVRDELLRA